MATSAESQIRRAFHGDDAEGVRRLLLDYPEFKTLINENQGPFNSPAITNVRSVAMLNVLVDAGADIDAKSNWWAGGFGILHTAPVDVALAAIDRGAKVDAHAAARLGLLDALRELVDADPSLVHAKGGDGQTPLHFASTVEIAEFLLYHGGDIDALDVDHVSTPAQYMLESRPEVARFLISRGCSTDLLMAAALGDSELVKNLLVADSSCIFTRVSDEYFQMIGGHNGGTIYQWVLGWYVSAHQAAQKFDHTEVFDLLMYASPPELRLITWCWLGDEQKVDELLTQDPKLADKLIPSEKRQLAHAARNNDTEAVRLMLKAGLSIHEVSQHSAPPLHWAAWNGSAEMVKLLLQHSPDLTLRDKDHNGTALGWAIYGSEHGWCVDSGDYPQCVEILINAGSPLPEQISGTEAVQEVLKRHNS